MTQAEYKYHVFLSHNGAQKDWTRRLANRLREHDLSVFFDEDSIRLGEDIPRAIEQALKSSRHIILILSPEALQSPWVSLEYSAILYKDPSSAERALIPILRTECDVPLVLARLKYLDARTEDLDRQVGHLLNAIERVPLTGTTLSPAGGNRVKSSGLLDLFTLGGSVGAHPRAVYVRREADMIVERQIEHRSLTTITGARQTGKTSLILQICKSAKNAGRPVAFIDLQMFGGGTSLPQLFYALSKELADLNQTQISEAATFLEQPRKAFFKTLCQLPQHTLLAIDEFDTLQGIDALEEFSGVLRAFWNSSAIDDQEISILIGSVLNPEQFIESEVSSGFNIGCHVHLGGFSRSEAETLFSRLSPMLSVEDADSLHTFVGGHPFLLQVAIYALARGTPLIELLSEPPKIDGPFGSHLRILDWAARNATGDSSEGFKITKLDWKSRRYLETFGLLSDVHGEPQFSCRLYESFFQSRQ